MKQANFLLLFHPRYRKQQKLVQEIAAASIEQNSGADQVNNAIQQLNQVTQQNAAASEELATSSEELAGQAEALLEMIAFFKIHESDSYVSSNETEEDKSEYIPELKKASNVRNKPAISQKKKNFRKQSV